MGVPQVPPHYYMDLDKLKKLVKSLGGILVISGNEPDFVILDYKKYIEIQNDSSRGVPVLEGGESVSKSADNVETRLVSDAASDNSGDQALIENLNKEIQALNEEIKQKEGETV